MAMTFSSSVRNVASMGESGMKKLRVYSEKSCQESLGMLVKTYYMTTEKATVMQPQKRKMIW